jgi:hypothetical protein
LFSMHAIAADALPKPAGRVILTVEGGIRVTNDGERAVFDREMLEALRSEVVRTQTPWTEGVTAFEGPLGAALLDAVGAEGTKLVITALNDYSVTIPMDDLRKHRVIFALKRDGEYMRVRDKGPLFLVYPFDDSPMFNSELYRSRSIWQIRSIRVE